MPAGRFAVQLADVQVAAPADLDWADVVLLGTPTRFGNVASQLKQFLDQLGPLWAEGKLADKVYAGFVSASTRCFSDKSLEEACYLLDDLEFDKIELWMDDAQTQLKVSEVVRVW